MTSWIPNCEMSDSVHVVVDNTVTDKHASFGERGDVNVSVFPGGGGSINSLPVQGSSLGVRTPVEFDDCLSDQSRSRQGDLIDDMKSIITRSRKLVMDRRRQSRDFRLESLRKLSSSNRYGSGSFLDESPIMDEASDILTDLPSHQSTPKLVLRSRTILRSVSKV